MAGYWSDLRRNDARLAAKARTTKALADTLYAQAADEWYANDQKGCCLTCEHPDVDEADRAAKAAARDFHAATGHWPY